MLDVKKPGASFLRLTMGYCYIKLNIINPTVRRNDRRKIHHGEGIGSDSNLSSQRMAEPRIGIECHILRVFNNLVHYNVFGHSGGSAKLYSFVLPYPHYSGILFS